MKILSMAFCLIIFGIMLGYAWHYHVVPVEKVYVAYESIAWEIPLPHKYSRKYKTHPGIIPAYMLP